MLQTILAHFTAACKRLQIAEIYSMRRITAPPRKPMPDLYHRLFIVLWLLALPSIIAAAGPLAPKSAPEDIKHILVLNSYNKGFQWTDNEVRGIEDRFADDYSVMLHIEYMDSNRISNADYDKLLYRLYQDKYRDYQFDVIIGTDDNALQFLRRYRGRLFADTPVVFCGLDNFSDSKIKDFEHYTGVNEQADVSANIDLIRKLHPNAQKVYVINNRLTATGKSLHLEFLDGIKDAPQQLQFIYPETPDLQSLQEVITNLDHDSVVYYLSFLRDRHGQSYHPQQIVAKIAALSPVPVYAEIDYLLGYGIIGGKLKSGYSQGQTAAMLAYQILAGKQVDELAVITDSPNRYMFDYRQLHRFAINPTLLPPDSIVINQPESLYYRYKQLFWMVLAAFAALTFYIATLLININKRKKAQRGLQTLLNNAALPIDTALFAESVNDRLKQIIPLRSEPLCLDIHDDIDSSPWEQGTLTPSAKQLIKQALQQQKSLVNKNNLVAFFNNKHLPVNIIYADGKQRFDSIDQQLLEMLTTNISMLVDNQEKQKIEESLQTARQIQMSMLPQDFSEFCAGLRLDIFAYLQPAKEVGGDLYDYFLNQQRYLFVLVGDVSDKGIPAALFMAITKTLIRSVAQQLTDPAEILHKVNVELCRNNAESMFVTLFLAVLDLTDNQLRYANAGHTPCYLVNESGRVESIAARRSLPLGCFAHVDYVTETLLLQSRQSLVLYSDGITEAMDAEDNLFAAQRLEKILQDMAAKDIRRTIERIVEAVKKFAGNTPQSDDMTVLMLKKQ